ncbi:hypothetical protein EIP91_002904 [Steccherinum ochraceum]|uniref:DUF6533 domain-containing protein n=1 Tax=Steccherinum ochraceum TaxID=92696 RepID=A0A4R0S0L9_9APHY|nr:hypothetical protein EIP91_002904 [Steccherinum ochraceum]
MPAEILLSPALNSQDEIIRTLTQAQTSRYVGVAALAFLVWDMLLNIADEVEYIWQAPSGWVKWAYLFIRHWAILSLGVLLAQGTNTNNHLGFTDRSCYNWIIAETVISFLLFWAVEVVLSIRIYALYARSKVILYTVGLLFIGETVTATVTFVRTLSKGKYSVELGCVVTWVPPFFIAAWIALLAFQTVLFILTMVHWFRNVALTKSLGRQSILYVFVRDGIWAYAVMFGKSPPLTFFRREANNATLATVSYPHPQPPHVQTAKLAPRSTLFQMGSVGHFIYGIPCTSKPASTEFADL